MVVLLKQLVRPLDITFALVVLRSEACHKRVLLLDEVSLALFWDKDCLVVLVGVGSRGPTEMSSGCLLTRVVLRYRLAAGVRWKQGTGWSFVVRHDCILRLLIVRCIFFSLNRLSLVE